MVLYPFLFFYKSKEKEPPFFCSCQSLLFVPSPSSPAQRSEGGFSVGFKHCYEELTFFIVACHLGARVDTVKAWKSQQTSAHDRGLTSKIANQVQRLAIVDVQPVKIR